MNVFKMVQNTTVTGRKVANCETTFVIYTDSEIFGFWLGLWINCLLVHILKELGD